MPRRTACAAAARAPVVVLFTDSTGDHGGGADGHAVGHREEDRDHGLGETDGRHGVGAQPGNKEGVGEGEDRLHDHLEDHGDREQDDGPADGPGGEVEFFAGEGQLHRAPDAEVVVGSESVARSRLFVFHVRLPYARRVGVVERTGGLDFVVLIRRGSIHLGSGSGSGNRRTKRWNRTKRRWREFSTSRRAIIGLVGAYPAGLLAFGGAAVFGMVPDPEANRLAMLPLLLFLPLAILGLVAGLVAIIGGIAALNRRRWGLSVAGAIAAIFGFFPVGIAAVIFTILAEPEFRAAQDLAVD